MGTKTRTTVVQQWDIAACSNKEQLIEQSAPQQMTVAYKKTFKVEERQQKAECQVEKCESFH